MTIAELYEKEYRFCCDVAMVKEHYDFSCWVVKYDRISIRGKIYKKDSLKNNDGAIVPLIWNHNHSDPTSVIGQALLENREEGIYAYFRLCDTPNKWMIDQMVQDTGSVSTSPYITQSKIRGDYIEGGIIREVSLVAARIDPDDCYYPVMKQEV